MQLRDPAVSSSIALALTGIFVLIYPPGLVRVRQAYVGGPLSDKDLELRLEASEMLGYLPTNADAWNSTSEGCGFRYNFNTLTGGYGEEKSLDDGELCIQTKALDLYAVQGVEISTAYEDRDAAQDEYHCEEGSFCWYRFSEEDLLRHTFGLGDVDFDILGVVREDLATWEVEGLLDIVDIRGPYALANVFKVCVGSSSEGFTCEIKFDLWGDPAVVEPSSASEGKKLAAAELNSLVEDEVVLYNERLVASTEICESFEGKVVMCDIECTIHYPYSSSLCSGSVEIEQIGDLPHSASIAALSLTLALVVLLTVPIRPCLAACKSKPSRPRAVEIPVIHGESHNTSQGYSMNGRGAPNAARQAGAIPMDLNAVGGEVVTLSLGSWPGCVVLVAGEANRGVVRVPDDLVVLAFCISERGTVRNATECEAIAMLEPSQRGEFAAASTNRNTIEWSSSFSLYQCISCVWMYGVLTHIAVASGWGAFYWLLALFSYTGFNQETSLGTVVRACRFRGKVLPYSTRGEEVVLPTLLGAAQLWYELELPNGWVLSWGIFVVIVVAVSANVILVTSLYSGLPTAENMKRVTRTAWSVDDAVELCTTSGSRFGMAGDWVERSRCGDIAIRTALMTSLGCVVPDGGHRLGHVYKRSQTSWAAVKGRGKHAGNTYGWAPEDDGGGKHAGNTYGWAPGDDGGVGVTVEQEATAQHPENAVILVCGGKEGQGLEQECDD